MKFLKNKFVIFISLIALFNSFFIFSKYDLNVFARPKSPLNTFDFIMQEFKNNYSYPKIKTVGFYTDLTGDHRIYILYELQDSIMPIFIDDSIKHDYVLCYSYTDACQKFAQDENMGIEGVYGNVTFYKRKGSKK